MCVSDYALFFLHSPNVQNPVRPQRYPKPQPPQSTPQPQASLQPPPPPIDVDYDEVPDEEGEGGPSLQPPLVSDYCCKIGGDGEEG